MAVTVTMTFGKAQVAFDAEAPKDAIRRAAALAEVFNVEKCGACGSENIRPEHRKFDDNEYYSWRCANCNAQLDLGQHKTGGTLFQKRYSKEDNREQTGGWYVFQGKGGNGSSRSGSSIRGSQRSEPEPAPADQDDSEIPF